MKKGNTPKRKRLSRKDRLTSGKRWLETNSGKNIVKRYSKWYGVDKLCAIKELRMIGVEVSQEYENQIKRSIADLAKERKRSKELRFTANYTEYDPLNNETIVFIAGHTSNGVPFGITHEEMEVFPKISKDSLKPE